MKTYLLSATTLLSLIACGETTAFKAVEAGKFNITTGSGGTTINDPDSESLANVSEGDASESDPETLVNEVLKDSEGVANVVQSDELLDDSKSKNKNNNKSGKGSDSQLTNLCSGLFQGHAKRIKIISSSSSSSNIDLDSETVLAFRLSGNQASLELNLEGQEAIAGICIIATGNQPTITITSSINMNKFVYIARGNQSKGVLTMNNEQKISASYLELKGNAHSLQLNGVEQEVCDKAVVRGNSKNQLQCAL